MREIRKTIRIWCETQSAIFVTLQLCGLIDWSWWWVLSPVWIGGITNTALHLVARKIDKEKQQPPR